MMPTVLESDHVGKEDAALLSQRIVLSRMLRKQRLRQERQLQNDRALESRPDIYFDLGPDGEYPIIAFRTVPCDLYVKGFCAPCSYSARPWVAGAGRDAIHDTILIQLDWILAHFDELFTRRARGKLAGYRFRRVGDRRDTPRYMMQLAGESSFFRDDEIPPRYRRLIWERLAIFQQQKGVQLHVMLETRPEHLVAAGKTGELDELASLFEQLNVVVNMGFEVADDWLREVVFMKKLTKEIFREAVEIAHAYHLDPGVFVYPGLEVLSVPEMLSVLRDTLTFLQPMGVFVNVMMPNLQAWTLPDVHYEAHLWMLPEPYFLLDVIDILLEYEPERPDPVTPFHWFLGGLVSDPTPRATLLSHPRRQTGDAATAAIHEALRRLVCANDANDYQRKAKALRCQADMKFHVENLEKSREMMARVGLDWQERLRELLHLASRYLQAGGYRP